MIGIGILEVAALSLDEPELESVSFEGLEVEDEDLDEEQEQGLRALCMQHGNMLLSLLVSYKTYIIV
uniref:Uncharacterized protein n=1 Tax=Arundo donax TaxID=35708 RepID=A0A0A9I2A1_ARUDO